ncbi:YfiT family bacillithiol transferase [Mucilaginibacter sp.]
MKTEEQLRYPTGRFTPPASYTQEDLRLYIQEIKTLPGRLRNAVIKLTDAQQNTPYRTGGWTLKQVVHHLADSHMHALCRIKFALTEANPTIKPYAEADWATLPDYHLPVESSFKQLEGIHQHLTALFESFTEPEWAKTFQHPELGTINLKWLLAQYAWHGKHHLAHITEKSREMLQ